MSKTQRSILQFTKIPIEELELLNKSSKDYIKINNFGINTPDGFVVSSLGHLQFLIENNLIKKINDLLSTIHFERTDSLMQVSNHIKKMVIQSKLPSSLEDEIIKEYKTLGRFWQKANVTIGNSHHKITNQESLITELKKTWAEKFNPKNLINAHENKIDHFTSGTPLIVKTHIDFKTTGKLFTSEQSIESGYELSTTQTKQLKAIGSKLKNQLYIPYEINWGIKKNKIYIIDVKPMTNVQKSALVLIRHGTSEYNEKGIWAGWDDPGLTTKGEKDAEIAADTLKNIHFDYGYSSPLLRHKNTLEIIKKSLNINDLPVTISKALMERNYGDYTAKNKWEVEKELGKEEFLKLRRGWNYPIPNGESLKDVYDRVVPYYEKTILPQLKSGKNIVITSSGNALRSLVKYLENISDKDISKLEIATGEVYVYQINEDGKVVNKEIRNQHENKV